MRRRWFQFLATFLIIMGSVYFYLGKRLISPGDPDLRMGLWILLGVPFLLLFLMPILVWTHRNPKPSALGDRFLQLVYLNMGFLSLLLCLVLARDLGLGLLGFLESMAGLAQAAPLPGVLEGAGQGLSSPQSGLWMAGLALLVLVHGFFQSARTPAVERVEVSLAGLPQAFEGYRILQLSDLHVSANIRRDYVERVVAASNALEPDLAVVTGDLVDGTVEQLKEEVRPLAGLKSKDGNFFVTGNHEYYWGAGSWVEEARGLGFSPLVNGHRVLEKKGAHLVLAGITDPASRQFDPANAPDLARALLGAPQGPLRILLAHQPGAAFAAAKAGFHLQLSGHTHAGQFWPWHWVVRAVQPFWRGLNRLGNLQVYVSRGTGYWGPPLRLGIPAEITLLTLKKA